MLTLSILFKILIIFECVLCALVSMVRNNYVMMKKVEQNSKEASRLEEKVYNWTLVLWAFSAQLVTSVALYLSLVL